MKTLTHADLKRLREVANKVEMIGWLHGLAGPANVISFNGEDIKPVAYAPDEKVADYIVRFDPPTVLALIALAEKGLDQQRKPGTSKLIYDKASGYIKTGKGNKILGKPEEGDFI